MELGELTHIWLIICPLVFLGGIIDAVAGGGGLITLPAYLLAGLPAHLASGTNKCGNAFGTFLSTGRFLKRGDVHYPSAVAGAVGPRAGAGAGAGPNLLAQAEERNLGLLVVSHDRPLLEQVCTRILSWEDISP